MCQDGFSTTEKNDSPVVGNTTSLEELIRDSYHNLSPAEKKLVAVLLEERAHLGYFSATELATKAGVSKSTAARCFRQLGFDDFNEFRRSVLPAASRNISPLNNIDRSLDKNGKDARSVRQRLESHLVLEKANLDQLFLTGQYEYMDECVQTLGKANRIWIAGFRNGYMLASYALAALSNVKHQVALLNGSDGRLSENLSAMEKGDALLLMDFPRRVNILSRIVQVAKEMNVTIVTFSDQPLSILTAQSNIVLTCVNDTDTSFNSYVAAISMINFLTNEMTLAFPESSRSALERIERMHQIMGDLADE